MAVQTTNAPGALGSGTHGELPGVAARDAGAALASLKGAFARWRDHVRRVRDYRRTVTELETLSDRELADFGLTRYDIRAAAKKAVFG